MFAVIKTGGKQYKIAQNDEIIIEKLDIESGQQHVFEQVLVLGNGDKIEIGTPFIDGASVVGEVTEQSRADKVVIFKKRKRSTYRRKKGHKQYQTMVKITQILTDGAKPAVLKKAVQPKSEIVDAAPKAKTPTKKTVDVKTTTSEKIKPASTKTVSKAKDSVIDTNGMLKTPQGDADDLTKLTGLGKVMAGKMNAAGVFHYWQLAALTPEQAEWLEGQIESKGRMERDDWIGQAKTLAKG